MMDIRRAAALLLALVMIAALTVGCGKKQSDTPADTPAAGADVRTPAQQPAKLVCYNGSVTLTVTYRAIAGETELTLRVGAQRDGGYYATVNDDDTIYLLPAAPAEALAALAANGLNG